MSQLDFNSECQWAQEFCFEARSPDVDPRDLARLQVHLDACPACQATMQWDAWFARELLLHTPQTTPVFVKAADLGRPHIRRFVPAGVIGTIAAAVVLIVGILIWNRTPGQNDAVHRQIVDGTGGMRSDERAGEAENMQALSQMSAAPVVQLTVISEHQDALTHILESLVEEND